MFISHIGIRDVQCIPSSHVLKHLEKRPLKHSVNKEESHRGIEEGGFRPQPLMEVTDLLRKTVKGKEVNVILDVLIGQLCQSLLVLLPLLSR